MLSHVSPPSVPLVHVEVLVSKPRVPIRRGAAPFGLGDVIVQVHIDPLAIAFMGNRIEDLRKSLN